MNETDSAAAAPPDLRTGIPSSDLPDGHLLEGTVEGDPVLITRQGGKLFAVGAHCPHYGAPLAAGLVVGGTIRCPWHHAAFDLASGDVVRPPAFDGLGCWEVREQDGRIIVTGRRPAGPATGSPVAAGTRNATGPESVIILGGGAAGLYAAETLRHEGYSGPVTIIEAGADAPYDRPNLSKDFLAGTAEEAWIPLRAPEWYAERSIELLLNTEVTAIDPAGRSVTLNGGGVRRFGALLIATGAEPNRLPPAVARAPVHYLRSLADSRAIIAAAGHARTAVVLGASFIGLETAAALRERGLDVTVAAPDHIPLERIFGPELGDFVRRFHEEHGVRFRLGRSAGTIEEGRVVLDDGEILPADLVVAGIGVRPRTELAERAGLAIDRGIAVDEYLETSAPGIYAAGDVARWPDARTGDRIRVEHWVVAERQGQVAGRNMLAAPGAARERFAAAPFFWSRHYDLSIQYTGHAERWTSIEITGDLAARQCSVTYRGEERELAVATLGDERASLAAEARMEGAMVGHD